MMLNDGDLPLICTHEDNQRQSPFRQRHLPLAIENDLPSGFHTSSNRNMNLPLQP